MDPTTAPRRPMALLLDDDGATSASYVRRLQHEGYQVTKTSDPAAALNLAQRSAPAIIFIKMGLSGSGSTAFLQALRKAHRRPQRQRRRATSSAELARFVGVPSSKPPEPPRTGGFNDAERHHP